jgi:hypothetical protein
MHDIKLNNNGHRSMQTMTVPMHTYCAACASCLWADQQKSQKCAANGAGVPTSQSRKTIVFCWVETIQNLFSTTNNLIRLRRKE